jgi:signal transduction histidine kinase
MKKRHIVKGISQVLIIMFVIWSIAFIAISLVYGYMNKKHTFNHLQEGAQAISALIEQRGEDRESLLQQLALLEHNRLIWIDRNGAVHAYGQELNNREESLDQTDIQLALGGSTVQHYQIYNPLHPGKATLGIPLPTEGTALFIQTEVPNVLGGYFQQLYTQLLASVIIMVVALFIGPRKREIHLLKSILDAMKRMAKGDFSISLEVSTKDHGGFAPLVEGLNEMAVELSQLEEMRQEFISNVSHEIQSPLTSISGFSRALQNDQLSYEERMHYLAIIETESTRLSKLSDNLLKLTSLESKHHPFEPREYRLDKQLRRIILSCEPQWQSKAIAMDITLAEIMLLADEDLLNQVWINLIYNSIKFTPPGGTIGLLLQLQENEPVVHIWDNGVGIAEEEQKHIFDRFYKADKSRNRNSGGSGLGLSIVKKIIDMHGGTVRVESTLGEGTAFIITLPNKSTGSESGTKHELNNAQKNRPSAS